MPILWSYILVKCVIYNTWFQGIAINTPNRKSFFFSSFLLISDFFISLFLFYFFIISLTLVYLSYELLIYLLTHELILVVTTTKTIINNITIYNSFYMTNIAKIILFFLLLLYEI